MTDRVRTLLELDEFPVLQNRMFASRDEARNSVVGDIKLVEDLQTGLVYNAAFESGKVVYDQDYENDQGHSARFDAHLNEVADLLESHLSDKKPVVELGCGTGRFLGMLRQRGFEVSGFDPAYVGDDPAIQCEYYTGDSGLPDHNFVLRHVLEHIQDPVDLLRNLARDAKAGTLIYIEVPCFDWICDQRAWFDVFYEHVNYFRLSDFHAMFDDVLFADRGFDGQYLRVLCDLSTLRGPVYNPNSAVEFPSDFLRGVKDEVEAVGTHFPVIWGGSSKGVIYALLSERAGRPVARVIDINPEKQGRYLAATGLKVFSPDDGLKDLPDGQVITVVNSNYLKEIRDLVDGRFELRGMFNG